MNKNPILVMDFETGSVDPYECEPLSVAALALDPRTFKPFAGGTFNSLMKPLRFDKVEDGALKVNKLTIAQLEQAPEQRVVWTNFVDFVNKYRRGNHDMGAPICAGHNVRGFDLIIAKRLMDLYFPGAKPLFNPRTVFDTMDISQWWFASQAEPVNYKLDTLRDFFGVADEGQRHSALGDVYATSEIIVRFLRLHQKLQESDKTGKSRVSFKVTNEDKTVCLKT